MKQITTAQQIDRLCQYQSWRADETGLLLGRRLLASAFCILKGLGFLGVKLVKPLGSKKKWCAEVDGIDSQLDRAMAAAPFS